MNDERETIDSAKERLKRAKKDIDKRHKDSKLPEPESIVSGKFDELDLKRRQKKDDDNE